MQSDVWDDAWLFPLTTEAVRRSLNQNLQENRSSYEKLKNKTLVQSCRKKIVEK